MTTTNNSNAIAKTLEYSNSGINDGNYSIVRLFLDNSETDIELFGLLKSILLDYNNVTVHIPKLACVNDFMNFFYDNVRPFEKFKRTEKLSLLGIEKVTVQQIQKIAKEILEF